MNEYESLLRVREEEVAGIGPWHWIASDDGAWDGPKKDWETSHINAIKDTVKNWDVCIQAGGNQGMYPRLLREHFKHVYTFEPDALNFHCLVMNCQDENIFKMQAALGAVGGLVELNRHSMTNTGMHTVGGWGTIPMVTLDSFNLDRCDYIMLDIEGYEINALIGAFNTIDSHRPVISCENGRQEILDFLKPLGYIPFCASVADTFFVQG